MKEFKCQAIDTDGQLGMVLGSNEFMLGVIQRVKTLFKVACGLREGHTKTGKQELDAWLQPVPAPRVQQIN